MITNFLKNLFVFTLIQKSPLKYTAWTKFGFYKDSKLNPDQYRTNNCGSEKLSFFVKKKLSSLIWSYPYSPRYIYIYIFGVQTTAVNNPAN